MDLHYFTAAFEEISELERASREIKIRQDVNKARGEGIGLNRIQKYLFDFYSLQEIIDAHLKIQGVLGEISKYIALNNIEKLGAVNAEFIKRRKTVLEVMSRVRLKYQVIDEHLNALFAAQDAITKNFEEGED